MKNIKKVLALFVVIVLILGILIVTKNGFNYGIEYKGVTELKFMLGQVLDMNEVNSIINEAFNGKELRVQKIDYFNDTVNISVVDPTEEEIQSLLDKLNDRYNQNNDMNSITRVNTANISLAEIIKPYVLPSCIALILAIAYMGFRYRKQNILKAILLPIFGTLIVEALFFAICGIIRLPITIWTMPIALILMVITLTAYAYKFEKNM